MECKIIELTRSQSTQVDAEDFDILMQHKWYCTPQGYAVRGVITKSRNVKRIFMHRQILNAPKGMEVDHVDGNRLNNRRSNLRLVTKTQNVRNSRPRVGGSSAYKGVNWLKSNHKWRARIAVDGKRIELGCYESEIDAAVAYNNAAAKYYGEYARLNVIEN